MKSQEVRLLDVLVLGPVMIWLAMQRRPLTPGERQVLWWIGLGTIGYNLVNYLRIQQQNPTDAGRVSGL